MREAGAKLKYFAINRFDINIMNIIKYVHLPEERYFIEMFVVIIITISVLLLLLSVVISI
jgi:hypothetical protein